MKALVTGGSGFIGGRIVRNLLERGWEVHVLGRSTPPPQEGVRFHKTDLGHQPPPPEACDGADALFHVAAKAGVWGSAASYRSANVLASRRVLHACREHGIPHLVHTSSPSVVFNRRPFRGADESLPYGRDWLCHYARTKALAEQEVLAANASDGLATTALRPHLVWGVGDPHLLPRVIRRARQGRLRIVGDGTNQVDISHVQNVADAHIQAWDALRNGKAAGKAYFLSQGEPVRLWDWLNDLLAQLNIQPVRKTISARKAYAAGTILESFWRLLRLPGEPPMTRFVAVELSKSHYFNIEAARRDLGYESRVSTPQGVEEYVTNTT